MRQVAPTEVRGLLGSVNQLVICIGILAALVVNVALPATSWRTMFALASIPAAILGLGMATFHSCMLCARPIAAFRSAKGSYYMQ